MEVPHCSFNFALMSTTWAFLGGFIGHLCILFLRSLFTSFAHHVCWGIAQFLSEFLYILDMNPLFNVTIANILLPVCGFPFRLFNSEFQRAEIFNFEKVQFSNCSLFICALLCVPPKKSLLIKVTKLVLLFSSRNSIILMFYTEAWNTSWAVLYVWYEIRVKVIYLFFSYWYSAF